MVLKYSGHMEREPNLESPVAWISSKNSEYCEQSSFRNFWRYQCKTWMTSWENQVKWGKHKNMWLQSTWSLQQSMVEGDASFGSIEEGPRIKSMHINIWKAGCTKDGAGCSTSTLKIKGGIVHKAVPCHVLVVLLKLQV